LVKKLGDKAFGRNNDLFKNFDVIDRLGQAKKRKCPRDIGIGILARGNWGWYMVCVADTG